MNLTLSSFTHKQQQQQQNVAAYDNSPSFRSVTGGGGGMSATALLLKAAQLGSTKSDDNSFCSGSNSVGVVMSSSSSSKNISIETNGNYFGGKGNGLRDFFGRKELGEGNNDELIIPSMEMTKFANSMSSEMGFSQFIGNNSVG
ncbi:protein indeterminate-domain 9 [Cucumis melo var. makuwa]|nr:protein indeterminate-domain 9 [Cucumis melo var. makuwa]